MLIRDALVRAETLLKWGDIEEPYLEADVLLRHVLAYSAAQLLARLEDPLEADKYDHYSQLLERRLSGEPTAYVVGHKELYGLDFIVDKNVLIPRPETELLVEMTLKYVRDRGNDSSAITIADIGTGCGNIAISLAKLLPYAVIYATDISPSALEIAQANSQLHGVSERVVLLQGDLLEPLTEPVDILVSNPPYIRSGDLPLLQREIIQHEPRLALDGGYDGLEVVRRLLSQAVDGLIAGGALFVEMGQGQSYRAQQLAHFAFPDAQIGVEKDLAGIDRVLVVYRQSPVTLGDTMADLAR